MRRNEPVALRPGLEKSLSVYALAGVAGLASVCPSLADAAVVYTKVDMKGGPNSSITIDLNHDGVVDFILNDIHFSQEGFNLASLAATAAPGDQIAINSSGYANALSFGAKIGFNREFTRNSMVRMAVHATSSSPGGDALDADSFNNAHNKFLGLKLTAGGQTYYGWARVDTSVSRTISFGLLDYAYESTPNAPIRAGQGIKSGAGASMLGVLAVGSDGIPAWRGHSAE